MDFLAAASSMFGPGFVWLTKNLDREGMLQILCTYSAGTPYPNAHARRQSQDMNTQSSDIQAEAGFAGSMGAFSQNQKNTGPGGLDSQPILCVNTWEHAWMMDYGIAGKDEYLERWWDRVNWNIVQDNYNAHSARKGTSRKAAVRTQGLKML